MLCLGLYSPPFLVAGTLNQHLESLRGEYPEYIKEIIKSLYVNDFISGRGTIEQACELKEVEVSVFKAAGFDFHKWHSNAPELEEKAHLKDERHTYAKEQLGVKPNEATLLGLPWHKEEDTLTVVLSRGSEEATKREILWSLASMYDP